ncbi:MAG: sulfite exporter TauE/SafE family protein [Candidatus Eiseniibacteriota bacterium]
MPTVLVGSAISGLAGLGGGALLIAVMASVLDPLIVIPVHGAVQVASNSSRALALLPRVCWPIVALYAPLLVIGVWLGAQLYRGAEAPWFKPAVGGFIAVSLVWERFRPKRLPLPRWVFFPAGLLGGFLTILVGAAGPFVAVFFLRDDLERREVVATQAVLQMLGHLLKIPAILSIGFDYGRHLGTILPLVACAVAGTLVGTRLLAHLPERTFRRVFRGVLGILSLRLLVSPWI